jgi:uncharacterized protein (DUF1330 family)
MPAYVIVRAQIIDAAGMKPYFTQADAVVARYGGRTIARGPVDVLEGDDDGRFAAVIEFPDKEKLLAFWHSPEFKKLIELRQKYSKVIAVAAAGV